MKPHTPLHILLLIATALLGYILWPYITPLILAAVVAALGAPLFGKIKKHLKDKGNLSALITTILIVVVIGIPLTLFTTLVTKEAIDVVVWTKQYVTEENIQQVSSSEDLLALKQKLAESKFGATIDVEKIQQSIGTAIKQIGTKLLKGAGALAAGIANFTVGLIIFVIALFFLIRDGGKLLEYLRKSPLIESRVADKLSKRFREIVDAIVFGNLAIAVLQGIVVGVAFPIFGLANGLLVGLATAILALIPAVGPLLIIVPAAGYLGLSAGWGIAATFAIITVALTAIIDNLLKPVLLDYRYK